MYSLPDLCPITAPFHARPRVHARILIAFGSKRADILLPDLVLSCHCGIVGRTWLSWFLVSWLGAL